MESVKMATQDGKYVCQVYWPPEVTDAGYHKVSCVMGDLLTRLLCGMVGCHFVVDGHELHDLRGVSFASLDEYTRVELIFVDCIAIEDDNA